MNKVMALVLAAALMTLPSCLFGGNRDIAVKAVFTDVGDLARFAPVMMSDVKVGEVSNIALRGDRAVVTMRLDPSADVPRGVRAEITRESVLGEQIIELSVPKGVPRDAPRISTGAVITNTRVIPELQDLVRSGTELFGAIGASQLATMINQGGVAFGGRGGDLKTLLRNLRTITGAYAAHSDMLRSLIRNVDALNSQLAPHAGEQARAVANADKALRELARNSDELARALNSLHRLSLGGRYILDRHIRQMRRFFEQMRVILGAISQEQDSLQQFLRWAPYHNRNVQLVEFRQFNQILQDIVICGLNDNPKDPARACHGTRAGGPH